MYIGPYHRKGAWLWFRSDEDGVCDSVVGQLRDCCTLKARFFRATPLNVSIVVLVMFDLLLNGRD